MYGSRLRPVMAVTALTWPRFSATRMITTGTMSAMACMSKTGVCTVGTPNQAAFEMIEKSMGLPMPKPLASTA